MVSPPDAAIRKAAEARQLRLTKPAGALGRLEHIGNWLAACQDACPPRPLQRPRVVVFAGDHGVTKHGVSAYPSEVTAQMVANFQAGGAAVNALAKVAGATVRVVDLAVDADTGPEASEFKVRRSSGSIDREDALTHDEVRAALQAGKAIADAEIDAGADLLIAGDMGIGNTTPATVVIAAITDTEPVLAVGRGTGVDDAGWSRKTAAIRDGMRRARKVLRDPVELLQTVGGADLAAMAGFLAQAAVRRTPVVLDGVVVAAAALVAEDLAAGAKAWWIAGHRSTEPAHALALKQLRLEPLLDLEMRLGEGSGALVALPILHAAIATLSEMATFADAGVSERGADPAASKRGADAAMSEGGPRSDQPNEGHPDADQQHDGGIASQASEGGPRSDQPNQGHPNVDQPNKGNTGSRQPHAGGTTFGQPAPSLTKGTAPTEPVRPDLG